VLIAIMAYADEAKQGKIFSVMADRCSILSPLGQIAEVG